MKKRNVCILTFILIINIFLHSCLNTKNNTVSNNTSITTITTPILSEYMSCQKRYIEGSVCLETRTIDVKNRDLFKKICIEDTTTTITPIFTEQACNQTNYPSGCSNILITDYSNPLNLYLSNPIAASEIDITCNPLKGRSISIFNEINPVSASISNITLSNNTVDTLTNLTQNRTYRVSLEANVSYSIALIAPNDANYELYLLDSSENYIISNRENTSKKNVVYTPTTTQSYTVQIKRSIGSGLFTLNISPIVFTPLTMNTEASSSITSATSSQWFTTSLRDGETYEIYLMSATDSLDVDLYIYDTNNILVASSKKDIGQIDGHIFTAYSDSLFKIQVVNKNNGSGSYKLAILDETFTLGTPKKNAIIPLINENNESINHTTWYRTTLQPNVDYIFTLTIPNDINASQTEFTICIYTTRGSNQITCSERIGQNIALSYTYNAGATPVNYWIRITASTYNGNNLYTLNSSINIPTNITLNTDVTNTLGENLIRWYQINLTANTMYKINLLAPTATNAIDFNIILYSTNNKITPVCISCNNSTSSTSKNARIYYTPSTTGIYLIKVEANTQNIIPFTLKVSNPSTTAITLSNSVTNDTLPNTEREKWYSITLTATGTPSYIINLANLAIDDRYWIAVYSNAIDGGITTIGDTFNDVNSLGVNLRWLDQLVPGSYKIKIEQLSGATLVRYSIQMNLYTQPSISTIALGNAYSQSFNFVDANGSENWSELTLTQSTLYTIDLIKNPSINGTLVASVYYLNNSQYKSIVCASNTPSVVPPNCIQGVPISTDHISILYQPTSTANHRIAISKYRGANQYSLLVKTVSLVNLVLNSNTTGSFSSTSINNWYNLSLSANQNYRINVTVPVSGDYDVYLYNASNTLVSSSVLNGLDTDESLIYRPSSTETYKLRIVSIQGTVAYNVLAQLAQ